MLEPRLEILITWYVVWSRECRGVRRPHGCVDGVREPVIRARGRRLCCCRRKCLRYRRLRRIQCAPLVSVSASADPVAPLFPPGTLLWLHTPARTLRRAKQPQHSSRRRSCFTPTPPDENRQASRVRVKSLGFRATPQLEP